MSAERKTKNHFADIERLYRKLEISNEHENLRTLTFSDNEEIRISRVMSAVQDAYFISIGNFRCYISKVGLEWVTLPQTEVILGNQKFVLAPRVMENATGDKVKAAIMVVDWIEECISECEIKPFATIDLL